MHDAQRPLWTEDPLEEALMREVDLFLRRNHFRIAISKEEAQREVFLLGYSLGSLRRGL